MLTRLLDLPFLRAPAGLPPHEARLFTLRATAAVLGGLLHVIQLSIFFALGMRTGALLSCGSVLVFALILAGVHRGYGRTAMFLVYAEVALHAVCLTLLFGPPAGYMGYYFSLVAAPFLVFTAREWLERVVCVGLAFGVAAAVAWAGLHMEPATVVPTGTLQAFALINTLGTLFSLLVMVVYFSAATDRAEAATERARAQAERLLLNVLPAPIAARLQDEPGTIADSFPAVTVLFADIVGFTALASRESSTELVRMLNDVFSRFDRLADLHGLEKIKTIGDAYMVVGGLPVPRHDHVQAVARMALDMRLALRAYVEETGRQVDLRIGLHTGPAVAGVIGVRKFAYDLWGDTVNTASRMESHGLPGRIQVTAEVRAALDGQFALEARGLVVVKGKGELPTWFLEGPAPAAATESGGVSGSGGANGSASLASTCGAGPATGTGAGEE